MARRILSAPLRTACHAIAAMLVFAVPASVTAQTLTNPAPQAKWSPPSKAAKAPPAKAAKSTRAADAKACSGFGPGFVNVPGTDACVKIGGWVTVEGSARR